MQRATGIALRESFRSNRGLPHGSALSCTLFLAYINDLPELLKCQSLLFADDVVKWKRGTQRQALTDALQRDLTTISCYTRMWQLEVNCENTVYAWFMLKRDTVKEPVDLRVNGTRLEKNPKPKYLGVTLDQKLTLFDHIQEVKHKPSA